MLYHIRLGFFQESAMPPWKFETWSVYFRSPGRVTQEWGGAPYWAEQQIAPDMLLERERLQDIFSTHAIIQVWTVGEYIQNQAQQQAVHWSQKNSGTRCTHTYRLCARALNNTECPPPSHTLKTTSAWSSSPKITWYTSTQCAWFFFWFKILWENNTCIYYYYYAVHCMRFDGKNVSLLFFCLMITSFEVLEVVVRWVQSLSGKTCCQQHSCIFGIFRWYKFCLCVCWRFKNLVKSFTTKCVVYCVVARCIFLKKLNRIKEFYIEKVRQIF